MNRRRAEYLVLDLETVPDTSRWSLPEVGHGPEPKVPFPPTWAHRIIVIGCAWLDADYRLRRIGVVGDREATATATAPDEREAQVLDDFARFVGRHRTVLVTYNGRSFDLPVIALRSLCHGVPLPWYYQERGVRYRYSEEGHIDLCDWLADHGATRSGSLDALARLCGLPGKVGVDGSQVDGLYQAGQLADIQRYCLADVAQTAFLFLRFRLLQGILSPTAYRTATEHLLDDLERDLRVAPVITAIDRDRLLTARDSYPLPISEPVPVPDLIPLPDDVTDTDPDPDVPG